MAEQGHCKTAMRLPAHTPSHTVVLHDKTLQLQRAHTVAAAYTRDMRSLLCRVVTIACLTAVFFVSGCATTQSAHRDHASRPQLASIQPVMMPLPPAAADEPPEDDNSAARLLERGFNHFRQDEVRQAGEAFRAAVATGHLNDAGRALAYWHIYLAERSQGRVEAGADALAFFIVVGDDVMEARKTTRYAIDDSGDFVDRFDLDRRLARARAILSAIWADKVPGFGRSPDRPVPVRDDNEKNYFLELAPPCNRALERTVREEIAPESTMAQKVTVTCDRETTGVDYYFMSSDEDLQ